MQRALVWLNLCGHEAVRHMLKNSLKNFHVKVLRIWLSPENDFCLVFSFLVFGYWFVQIFFCLFSMKNTKEVHVRKCLFLYNGWFLQNLDTGCIRANMHTTVTVL